MQTYRITSPYFVAGIVREGDHVIQAAPILGWTVNRDWAEVLTYLNKRGFRVEPVLDETPSHIRVQDLLVMLHGNRIVSINRLDSNGVPYEEVEFDDLPSHQQEAVLLATEDEEEEE